MNAEIKGGQIVYTSDGEKLGTVKEVVERPELTYFRVGVTLRPDYWIGATGYRMPRFKKAKSASSSNSPRSC